MSDNFDPFQAGAVAVDDSAASSFDPFAQGGAIMSADDAEKARRETGRIPTNPELRAIYEHEKAMGLGERVKKNVEGFIEGAAGLAKLPGQVGTELGEASTKPMFSDEGLGMKLPAAYTEGIGQTVLPLVQMVTKPIGRQIDKIQANPVGGTLDLLTPSFAPKFLKPSTYIGKTDKEKEFQNWKLDYLQRAAEESIPTTPESWRAGVVPPAATSAVAGMVNPLALATMATGQGEVQAVQSAQRAARVASALKNLKPVGATVGERVVAKAGELTEKAGRGAQAVGQFPGKVAEAVTTTALGPETAAKVAKATKAAEVASIPAAGALAAGGLGVPAAVVAAPKAIDLAGHAVEAAGATAGRLAKADRSDPWGRLHALAKDASAPEWMRRLAASNVAKAAGRVGEAAKAVAKDTVTGAVVGGVMNQMIDDSSGAAGRGAGAGAVIGGTFGATTTQRQRRANLAAKDAEAVANLTLRHINELGVSPETLAKVNDSTMSLAANIQHLFGDVKVNIVDGKKYAAEGMGKSAGAWDAPRRTIWINADATGRPSYTALLHELIHPLFESEVTNQPQLRQSIDTALKRSGSDINKVKLQYAERLTHDSSLKGAARQAELAEVVARLDSDSVQRAGDPNVWAYAELMSETGARTFFGKKLTDVTAGALDQPVTAVMRGALEKLGVKFKEGEKPGTLFPDFTDVMDDPELRRTAYRIARTQKDFLPGISKGVEQSVKITPDMHGQHPAAPIKTMPDGSKGNDFVAVKENGEIVNRKPFQTKRIIDSRRAEVNATYPATVTPLPVTDTTPDIALRQTPSGNVERTGTVLGPKFRNLTTFGPETKAMAAAIEKAIADGEGLSGWYQQIGEGPDWKASVRKDTGALTAQHKDFIPFNFLVDKQSNILVRNFSLSALDRKAARWAKKSGEVSLDLWGGDVAKFKDDVRTYLDNHNNGVPGETGIGQQKRDTINAFMVGGNRTFEAKNPLRKLLHGEDRQGIVRAYRLDRLETLEPLSTDFGQPQYGKQVHNLTPDAQVTLAERPKPTEGDAKAQYDALVERFKTAQGAEKFALWGEIEKLKNATGGEKKLPAGKATPQYSPAAEGYKGESIKEAAIRTKDGKVFTGRYHGEAFDKAGLPNGTSVDDGFITSRGRFVSRENAAKIAARAKQIDLGEYKDMAFELHDEDPTTGQPVQLEAMAFENTRQFSPDTEKPTGWITPDGKYRPLAESLHEENLAANAEDYNKRFGTKLSGKVDEGERAKALDAGFVRMRSTPNGDMTVELNAKYWDKHKKAIRKQLIAKESGMNNLTIRVIDDKGRAVGEARGNIFMGDDVADVVANVKIAEKAGDTGPTAIQRMRALPSPDQDRVTPREVARPAILSKLDDWEQRSDENWKAMHEANEARTAASNASRGMYGATKAEIAKARREYPALDAAYRKLYSISQKLITEGNKLRRDPDIIKAKQDYDAEVYKAKTEAFAASRKKNQLTPDAETRVTGDNAEFTSIPDDAEITEALHAGKKEFVGAHRKLEAGTPVGLRIDIPAFNEHGKYVVTVHEKARGGTVGKRIGYDGIATVDNPVFMSNEKGATKIKSGQAKFPVATVEGEFNPSRTIPKDINDWTPVGYDPKEHSFFYSKEDGTPVTGGSQAISVGNTVFVKDPVFGDPDNYAYSPDSEVKKIRDNPLQRRIGSWWMQQASKGDAPKTTPETGAAIKLDVGGQVFTGETHEAAAAKAKAAGISPLAIEVAERGRVGEDGKFIAEPQMTPDQEVALEKWAGKTVVRGEDGKPALIYHLAGDDFTKFRPGKADSLGIHVGTKGQVDGLWRARTGYDSQTGPYSTLKNANVKPLYAKFEKPLRLEDPQDWQPGRIWLQLENQGLIDSDTPRPKNAREARELIKSLGYDSVVYLNRWEFDRSNAKKISIDDTNWVNGVGRSADDAAWKERFPFLEDSYIALDPKQLKSMSAEKFDPKSADIMRTPDAEVDPKLLSRYSTRISNLTEANGGSSFSIATGKPYEVGKSALFSVAAFPERSKVIPAAEFNKQAVADYIAANADLLTDAKFSMGTWKDGDKVWLDVAWLTPNREMAIEAGKKFNQKAIFDLKKGEEVPTGGTGEASGDLGPNNASRIQSLIGRFHANKSPIHAEAVRLETAAPGLATTGIFSTPKFQKVGRALHQRKVDAIAGILTEKAKLNDNTPEAVAHALADEAQYSADKSGNAADWYEQKIAEAMDIVSEAHPELKTDPAKFKLFKLQTAITSNGIDTLANFERADRLYTNFKENGKVNIDDSWGGKTKPAIDKGLSMLQTMIDTVGLEKTLEFMEKDFTVGELKKAGFNVTGELVDHKVKGAMIFGPKIGSFFGNLNGDFSSVTMDRWFMRTINRMRGTLTEVSIDSLPRQIDALMDAIKGKPGLDDVRESAKRIKGEAEAGTLDPVGLRDEPFVQYAYDRFREYANDRFTDRSDLNKASKNIYESVASLNEAPANGSDRKAIRKIFARTQEILKQRGVNLSNAALQAVLWYYEKELYTHLGYDIKRGAPADYAQAARTVADRHKQGAGELRRVADGAESDLAGEEGSDTAAPVEPQGDDPF